MDGLGWGLNAEIYEKTKVIPLSGELQIYCFFGIYGELRDKIES
jgi:hypothetical protein